SGPPPAANPTPPVNPTPAPTPPPVAVTPPAPTPTPPAKTVVTPLPPAPPRAPVVVAAEPLSPPQPKIPDDLSADTIHDDFKAVFTIGADGDVAVRMTASTGNATLDSLALDAARRWTFRPATVDGKPVSSFRRFVIQFEPT
ncbi:MAG: energy transducer TonB, partial [Armatimonadota bacterium]|nr:energy transducer TonB [Armatimonadota bacterium]